MLEEVGAKKLMKKRYIFFRELELMANTFTLENINKVRIKTPSRIHISLIDLNGSLGRIDGGVGFSLDYPYVEIEVKANDKAEIKNIDFEIDNARWSSEYKEKFIHIFENLRIKFDFNFPVNVKVLSGYKPHCGLGSGTQTSLAIACAFNLLSGLEFNVRELAKIAGRGGTSGIGVAAFEGGGFILDAGHSKKVKEDFLPSSASKAPPPEILVRYNFPWKVAVAVPEISGFFGGSEVNLFKKYCPIPLDEVREVAHIVLVGLLPSVVERDLDLFNKCIEKLQKTGFKKVEVERYSFMRELLDTFKGVGMSSTGTAVYTVVDSTSEGKKAAKDISSFLKEKGIECEWFVSEPNNRGAEVVVE